MYSRKLQLPFAITITTKKCQLYLFTYIKRKVKKIIKYTMTILRRQLIMNKPYIKDQYKPNLITPECSNIPRIADSVTIKEQ